MNDDDFETYRRDGLQTLAALVEVCAIIAIVAMFTIIIYLLC